MKVTQLHRSQVKRLLVEKHERGLSKDTIRLIRATISAMYASAIEDGVAIVNPATLPRRAKALGRPPKADIRPLSESEFAAFLNTAEKKDPFYYPFFVLLARAGLRPGVARALNWSNVDFANRKLTVAHSLSEEDKIEDTKTGTTRYVDLSQELAQILRWLHGVRKRKASRPRRESGEDWILFKRQGQNPLTIAERASNFVA
jgi:integrase